MMRNNGPLKLVGLGIGMQKSMATAAVHLCCYCSYCASRDSTRCLCTGLDTSILLFEKKPPGTVHKKCFCRLILTEELWLKSVATLYPVHKQKVFSCGGASCRNQF